MKSLETLIKPGEEDVLRRYGREVLCASWTPQVTGLAGSAGETHEALAQQDASETAGFLARYYRSQRM